MGKYRSKVMVCFGFVCVKNLFFLQGNFFPVAMRIFHSSALYSTHQLDLYLAQDFISFPCFFFINTPTKVHGNSWMDPTCWLHALVISVGIFVWEEKMTVRIKENICAVRKNVGVEKASFDYMHRRAFHWFGLVTWSSLVSEGPLILNSFKWCSYR